MTTKVRRPTEWYTTENTAGGFEVLNAGGQTNLPLFTSAQITASAIKGSTVTRLLMQLLFRADSVAQTNILHWGIVVINGDAASAGVFPDPQDLSDRAGWMARGKLLVIQDSLSDASQWAQAKLDLRGQRVLHNEEDQLHLIVNNSGSFVGQWSAYIRTLMKMAS